jgi:hypothetical protein
LIATSFDACIVEVSSSCVRERNRRTLNRCPLCPTRHADTQTYIQTDRQTDIRQQCMQMSMHTNTHFDRHECTHNICSMLTHLSSCRSLERELWIMKEGEMFQEKNKRS